MLSTYSKTITHDEIEQNEKSRLLSKYFSFHSLKSNKKIKLFPEQKKLNSPLNKDKKHTIQTSSKDTNNLKTKESSDLSHLTVTTAKNSFSKKIEIDNNEIMKTLQNSPEDDITDRNQISNYIRIEANYEKKPSYNISGISSYHLLNGYNSSILEGFSTHNKMNQSSSMSLKSRNPHSRNIDVINERSKRNKMYKTLFDNEYTSQEVSERYINDELIFTTFESECRLNKTKDSICLSNYNFISSIKDKTNSLPHFKKSSFINISHYAFFTLLSFCYDNEELFKFKHCAFSDKIKKSLSNILSPMLVQFKIVYKDILKMEKFTFTLHSFQKRKKKFPVLDLIIRSKIISKESNKCYTLKCSFLINNTLYYQEYKFDVNSKLDKTWISTEPSHMRSKIYQSYMQPIFPLKTGDYINIHFTLFSSNSIVDPNSITWDSYSTEEIPNDFYQKNFKKSKVEFDSLRACEYERAVLFWKSENLIIKKSKIEEVKEMLQDYFIIDKIMYEYIKGYYFKIEMTAKKVGVIPHSKLITCDIEVVSKDKEITKDIGNICTLNVLTYKSKVYIRINTNLILYIANYI